MLDLDLSQPNRQSVLGVVVYILRNFRAMGSLLLTFFILGAAKPQLWLAVGIGIIPLAVGLSIFAYWQYRNFTFQLQGEDLIIHKGVIFKERVVIPADRIQSIKIAENVVQRILGLVALKVDTAGSAAAELEIPALERKLAMQLKDLLYAKKEEAIAQLDTEENPENNAEAATEYDASPNSFRTPRSSASKTVEKKVLVKLSIFDLIVVGLTENHLKTGFIALAVMFGYISQYMDYIESYLEEYVDEYAAEVANGGFALALTAFVIYALVSVAISMVRTFSRFYGLKAQLEPEAVEIETGLLKRQYDRVPVRKVQFVEWETNPLRRLVGFESARLHPTNPMGAASRQQRIEIPALRKAQSLQLAEGIFTGYSAPQFGFKANAAAYARINTMVMSVLLAPAVVLLCYYFGALGFLPLLVLPAVAFLAWQYGRRVALNFDHDYLLVHKGWIFPERMVMPLHKLQSVSIAQNIFLKRRKLCHLKLYTAAGGRTVRYIAEGEATQLYNYLLWCVERSDEDWM